jgi:hypothetical protein
MSHSAILCYIYSGSLECLLVYSLVGGLVSGSSVEYWLVHIVVPPMGLQTPSAPWVLSLASPLGTLHSVQWMALSLSFYICQVVVEPLGRCYIRLLSASSCWHSQYCQFWWLFMGWISRWSSHVVFVIYIMEYLDGFPYIEPSLHPWDEAYLIMMDDHFEGFLDSLYENFIRYFFHQYS